MLLSFLYYFQNLDIYKEFYKYRSQKDIQFDVRLNLGFLPEKSLRHITYR